MQLLPEFEDFFQNDLPAVLPPEREVDHPIEIETGHKLPHNLIFQLSPVQLAAAKEYIAGVFKKGKICSSRSPCGSSFFYIKFKGKLHDVIDY